MIWILPWAESNVDQPALRRGVEQGGHLSAVSFLSCVFSNDGSSTTSSPLPCLGTWLNFPTLSGIPTGPCSMKMDTWSTLLLQVWSRLVPPADSSQSQLELAETWVHRGTIITIYSFFWGQVSVVWDKASVRSRLKGRRVCVGLSWVVNMERCAFRRGPADEPHTHLPGNILPCLWRPSSGTHQDPPGATLWGEGTQRSPHHDQQQPSLLPTINTWSHEAAVRCPPQWDLGIQPFVPKLRALCHFYSLWKVCL